MYNNYHHRGDRTGVGIYQQLNRHATTLMIGAVFLFLSGVVYTMMCGIGENQPINYVDHARAHDQSGRSLWKSALRGSESRSYAFLVAVVVTSPANFKQRMAIRKTWASTVVNRTHRGDAKVYFAIGTKALAPEAVAHLKKENSVHDDLILLSDVHDGYDKLTDKVLKTFVWLDSNVDYRYVLKTDDDSYVRLRPIFDELKRKRTQRLYWGFFYGNGRVKHTGQWAEKDWVLCDRYLPYARGGGYVISADLVHYLAATAPYLKRYKSEDVSVGAWLAPLEINRLHDPRFDTEYRSRGCHDDYLITHKKTIEQLNELHSNLVNKNKLCAKQFKLLNSYIYNWSVLPSQCCIRDNSSIP
ncbi:beta-1,3-galactosyltransferase 6-like [Tubulanus polymorphus]|uniref:beta-1,3-galactosyltransferase 6-like n=1 Tax=Tubulanus polymorphus TaxID=672921 RepID=UPI003DA3B058